MYSIYYIRRSFIYIYDYFVGIGNKITLFLWGFNLPHEPVTSQLSSAKVVFAQWKQAMLKLVLFFIWGAQTVDIISWHEFEVELDSKEEFAWLKAFPEKGSFQSSKARLRISLKLFTSFEIWRYLNFGGLVREIATICSCNCGDSLDFNPFNIWVIWVKIGEGSVLCGAVNDADFDYKTMLTIIHNDNQ